MLAETRNDLEGLNPNALAEVTEVVGDELNYLISQFYENSADFFELEQGDFSNEELEEYVSDLIAEALSSVLGQNN